MSKYVAKKLNEIPLFNIQSNFSSSMKNTNTKKMNIRENRMNGVNTKKSNLSDRILILSAPIKEIINIESALIMLFISNKKNTFYYC